MYNKLIEYITHSNDEVVILLYKELIDLKLIDKMINVQNMNQVYNYIDQSVSLLKHNNIVISDNDIKNNIVIFKKINAC